MACELEQAAKLAASAIRLAKTAVRLAAQAEEVAAEAVELEKCMELDLCQAGEGARASILSKYHEKLKALDARTAELSKLIG